MNQPVCPFEPSDLEPIGSTWLLANFHTHTPGSSDYTKALVPSGNLSHKDVARGILEDCLAQNIRVVAITDHNSPSFVRKAGADKFLVDPEQESYYAMMRALMREEPERYGGILVLPGVEIGAENIHVLGIFPPSEDPGWDVLSIAAILKEGNCPPDFYGNAMQSCTDFSVADAIDIIDARGGIAIPAHIDGASGFLEEESQERLLKMIVSRPHLYAVEYLKDSVRVSLERLLSKKRGNSDIYEARKGRSIAWTQSCDAHFVKAYNSRQSGNGKALGTEDRRTWLRLDPNALSFEAVRAALLDPENRVRVDSTRKPRGRQGEYRPLPSDQTYVRSMYLNWGNNHKEKMPFNEGINTIVGAPGAGKSSRTNAFSVAGCAQEDMIVAGRKGDADAPALRSVDMLLEYGIGSKDNALWWIHRKSTEQVFVAPVEISDNKVQVAGDDGAWVDLCADGHFSRWALPNHLKKLPAALVRKIPAVPQGFSLTGMKSMLDDQVRTMRFVEAHYMPAESAAEYHRLHEELFEITGNPGSVTEEELAAKLSVLFGKLEILRRKAVIELNRRYRGRDVALYARRYKGKWSRKTTGKAVAKQLLEASDAGPDELFNIVKELEDRVVLSLKFENDDMQKKVELSDRLGIALQGLLLVIGGRNMGPVVIDAPEAYFEPSELADVLAPMLLDAREEGSQFVIAVDDTNVPFAVDANALLVCDRDPRPGRVGPFNDEVSGGIENKDTALWALHNLDGGGKLFDRREQYYATVLGSALAEKQEQIASVLLSMTSRKR